MLKWFSNDDGGPDISAPGSPPEVAEGPGRQLDPAELQERLSQTEQLVSQLKELIRDREAELQSRDQQLKASDAKLSKMRLQHKAKVTSLSAQLDDLRKDNIDQGSPANSRKQGGGEVSDQASRGKILLFKKRVEELEQQLSKKDEELETKTQALASQQQRGEHMDTMLQDRERRLLEKEAYIVHLQTALAGDTPTAPPLATREQMESSEDSAALLDLQVQNLTRKVGEGEERCSLLEEQNQSLKNLLLSERTQHEEKENMYKQNIQTFKDIIQQKDGVLAEVNQKHEQELFKMAAKQDASSDLEQLLKALKQKLHEKEEVLQGKNQVISVLQDELDGRDQQIQELSERARRLQVERENLRSQMEAEKHVMRAQLRDRMQSHEAELRRLVEEHRAELAGAELAGAEQTGAEQLAATTTSTPAPPPQGVGEDAASRVAELEVQARLKTEEASKSEAKFMKMKAWSKSRIRQLEEELRKAQGGGAHPDLQVLRRRVSELEEEREENSWRLEQYDQVKNQNDELQAKLILYEEQQRKMQCDLEQVTKRAASQASESGSADDGQLLEWQEMLSEGGASRTRGREDKVSLGLRMANMEEDREVLAGQQQGMEGELAQARALEVGRGRRPGAPDQRSLEEEFEFEGCHGFPDQCESNTPMEGENMGEGLRSVVEELEQERNQLQEQMVLLEERCQELEDRLQMQTRIETLQSESARLQSQLASLRSQQCRDTEKQQLLVASLNEQIKGLTETQECLESSLQEKDARLAQTADTQELLDELRGTIQTKDGQHRELTDKLQQAQHGLIKVSEECKSFEKQCSDLKASEADLTQKLGDLREKAQKQETTIEALQSDLDQTTDELDKINTAHLEERAQLIQDLQTCEREMDHLKDILQERDRDMAALQGSIAEQAEQMSKLTQEIKLKEEQLVLAESSLRKAERETQIFQASQDSDQRSLNCRMLELAEHLKEKEEELNQLREEKEAKTGEIQELTKKIQEDKRTIQDLRRDMQKQNVVHDNHLSECEAQIGSLKDQVTTASQKLQESNNVISLLKESESRGEELKHQMLDKEQTYENELKSIKDERNKLLAELDKLHLEIQTITRQLEEKSDNISKLEELLKSTEIENKQLQSDVRGTTEKLKSQKKHLDGLSKKLKVSVDENAQLKTQVNALTGNHLSLQTELSEMTKSHSELLNEKNDLQSHMSVFELQKSESHEMMKGLQKAKEDLGVRVQELNEVLEQNKQSFSEELHQKTTECTNMAATLTASEGSVAGLQDQIHSLNSQLQQLHDSVDDKEKTVLNLRCQLTTLENEAAENISLRQELEQKQAGIVTQLRQELEQRQAAIVTFQSETRALTEENQRLHAAYEIREKELSQQRQVASELDSKVTMTLEQSSVMGSQLHNLTEQNQKLKQEVATKETFLSKLNADNSFLQEKITSLEMQHAENHKKTEGLLKEKEDLRVETEELKKVLEQNKQSLSESLQKKTQECSELSRAVREKDETAARLQESIDNLNAQIHQLHNHLQEKQQALTEQNSQINSQREQLSRLQETMSLLQEQGASLKAGLLEKSTALLQSAEECGSLRQEVEMQRDVLTRMQMEAEALREERLELSRRLEEKEEILNSTTGEFENYKEELDQRNETVRSLSGQLGAVTEDKDKLEVEVTQVRAALKNHAAENERLRQDVAQKQKEVSDLKDKMQSLNEQNLSLNSELQRLVTETSKSVEETSVLRSENTSRDEQIGNLTEQLNAACTLKDTLESTLLQKDKKIRLQQVFVKKLKAMVEEGKGGMNQKAERITELQAQVHHLQEAIVDRDESLRHSENERSAVQEQLRRSEALNLTDSESLRLQMNSSVEMSENLQSELTRLKGENVRLCGEATERNTQLKQAVDGSIRIKTRVSELEDVISQLRCSLNTLTAESSHLKDSLKDREQAIADHKTLSSTEIKRLHLNLQAKESECESLRGEASSLQEFISKLNNDLLSQASETASLKESLRSQAAELHTLNERAKETARLDAQLAERTQLVVQLQSQLQLLSAGSERLSRTLEDNQSAFVNLQEKYTAVLEELQDAKEAFSQKTEELSCLHRTLDDHAVQVQTAESVSQTLKNESLLLRQELQRLQTINMSLSEQHEDSLAAHHSITSALTAEVETFKSQCLHTAAQVQVLTEQLQQKDASVQSVSSQYAALVKHAERLASEMKRLEGKNKELEGEAARMKQDHQQQLEAVLNERAQLQREMWAVVAERDEARSVQKKRDEVRTHQKQEQILLLASGGKEAPDKMAASEDKPRNQKGVLSVEEAPGAPQERSSTVDVINTLAANQLQERLGELQRTVEQLNQTLSEEKSRRVALEEALKLAEDQVSESGSPQRDVSIQMQTEDEWEGLVLDPNQPLLTQKVRGGVLAWRRWLRGRSLYCSKLLRTRGRSRYLFLSYLVTLHLVVLLCLTGAL